MRKLIGCDKTNIAGEVGGVRLAVSAYRGSSRDAGMLWSVPRGPLFRNIGVVLRTGKACFSG